MPLKMDISKFSQFMEHVDPVVKPYLNLTLKRDLDKAELRKSFHTID